MKKAFFFLFQGSQERGDEDGEMRLILIGTSPELNLTQCFVS